MGMTGVRLKPVGEPSTPVPTIEIGRGDTKTIGRSNQADIVLDEPSLSRLHARISMTRDGIAVVEDLGSTNGVFFNGSLRRSGNLKAGDRVRLGSVEFELEEIEGGEPPPAPTEDRTYIRVPIPAAPKAVNAEAIQALLDTSKELMAFADLQGLLDRVLDRLQAILTPDRSAILLLDEKGELITRAVRPAGAYTSVSDFGSTTAVRQALASKEVLVSYDARADSRLAEAQSIVLAGVRSTIVVPLLGRAGAIGALYADQLLTSGGFTPDHVQYAGAFAAHAAAALETAQLYEDRERMFRLTLEAFAKAIDARDHYTSGHSERVTKYTLALAKAIGIVGAELDVIRRAGMLHDIGKVGVPDNILLKPGPLEPSERAMMESHVTIGYSMLHGLPFLVDALPSIRGHHERWDGKGYPDKLAGLDIHRHARLMGVGDSFDAMTSARPYRNALPMEEAIRRVHNDRGKQFDPEAVDAFDQVYAEFNEIREAGLEQVRVATSGQFKAIK
jgi:putative nucleotidyltransferase with HDIG domain